ncbi:HAD-IC family P-type ATPase [Salinisphaera hydrothermalis]|uniref:HAD-IC family P-type ATPase n=1 Tax=Salinisphaera hydrothermalis TaxID=563188 RepID=UPI000A64B198|nr:HAD-IC family P-type ATPase [Salinisphaera hydrothermalis]
MTTPGPGHQTQVADATVLVGNQAWMTDNGIDVPASLDQDAAGSEILVARDGRLLGAIAIADSVRPESQRAVDALHRMGIRIVLLTGDARRVADAVGGTLGIQNIEAELLPENKLARVQALVGPKHKIAMVGDGINDAPALARADVGIAMGSGTDVAQESADVVLLGNDLESFVETLAVARRTRGIIWQNFAGTSVSTPSASCWRPWAFSIRCSRRRFMSSPNWCSSSTQRGCCPRPRKPRRRRPSPNLKRGGRLALRRRL